MIQTLKQWLRPPPTEDPEDLILAQILRLILIIFLIAEILAILIFIILENWIVTRVLGVGLVALLVSGWLFARRLLRPAGILVAFGMQITFAYLLYVGNGVYDEAIIAYTLSTFVGSLLLRRGAYILFTSLTVFTATWLAYVDASGRLHFISPQADATTVVTVTLVLTVTAVTARLLTSTLRTNLIHSRQNERTLTIINTISDALHRSLHSQTVAERAVDLIVKHLNVPLVVIYTLDEEKQRLTRLAGHGNTELIQAGQRLPLQGSLSGAAVRQRETIICPDLTGDPRAVPAVADALIAKGYTSAIIHPIISQKEVLGTINLLFESDQVIDPGIEAKLTPLARSIGLALHNARLMMARQQAEAEVQQHAKRALTLSQISQLLAEATQDYDRVLTIVVRRLAQLIGDSCIVSLISEDGRWLELAAVYHPNPEIVAEIKRLAAASPQRADEGQAGRVAQSGKPLLIPESDWPEMESIFKEEYRRFLTRFPIYSRVFAPLRVRGEIIGVIDLSRFRPGHSYTKADMHFLQDLADRAALAISNARLYAALQAELEVRQEAEAAQETLIRQLEASNAELEHFAYTVSHDLKSPLVTIRGFLGLLEKDAAEGNMERLQVDMRHIQEATEKMQTLIDELLHLSRIGRITHPPQTISFTDLVEEALHLVAGPVHEKGIEVSVAPDLPAVHGDRPRLVDMLHNLLSNAIKYMGDQETPRIEIGALEQEGETVFFVRDNGVGIPPAQQQTIFNLFERGHSEVEGTGIGLALVKRIVEVHNGRVWVESKGAGRGSTFYFTLPHSPTPSPPSPGASQDN